MQAKKFMLAIAALLALIGLFAVAGNRYWRKIPVSEIKKELPAASEEYRRIMERYAGADSNLDLSGNILIYDGENKYSLKERSSFSYIRSGRQYYYRLSRLQTFCDGSTVLQLDTVNKRIIVSTASHSQASNDPGTMPFDRLFSDTARFRINGAVSEQGSERVLRIQSDYNPGMRSYSLRYDTTNYRLLKAEVEWWKTIPLKNGDTNKIWLAKIDYRYQEPGRLDMDKKIREVISKTDGQVKPSLRYKDYQVNTGL
jgi:hypothetical protein